MKNLLRDEQGSILPIVAFAVVVIIALAAVAVDFARYSLASEKLKTAGEAAAVAGGLSATRYVRLEIDPGSSPDCCGDEECVPCCTDCGDPITVEGKEKDLIDNNGWESYCCGCGCDGMEILDRWVVYEGNNAEAAAEMFFDVNKPKEMDTVQGGSSGITKFKAFQKGEPYYPSVMVETSGTVKTLFLSFLNKLAPGADFSHLNAIRCSQGLTYYYDLNGKWHRTAPDPCTED